MILSRFYARATSAVRPLSCIYLLSRNVERKSSILITVVGRNFLPRKCNFSTATKMYSPRPPCNVGDSLEEVETPCLLICMTKLEKNIQKMTEVMKAYPQVALRPHVKTHKCAALGRMQIQNGAVGVCCQTLTEAEAMVDGGISDVMVTNQVIGKKKTFRLAALAHSAKISVCVDNADNITDLNQAATDLGVKLDLVVEVNVGQHRCGVEPGEDVSHLAKQIKALPSVTFKGLQCYNGWNQHVRSYSERKEIVEMVAEKSRDAIQILKDSGIDCDYVTGGGTGSFCLEAESGVFTEVQPGSYVFMDADYNKNLNREGTVQQEFEQSLYLFATVQSISGNDRAVVDAGMKAVSIDSGVPLVTGGTGDQIFYNGGDEHGIILPRGDFSVGAQVWLIPGHCDPTVNMHDWLVGVRDGKVECLWRVNGRGPGV